MIKERIKGRLKNKGIPWPGEKTSFISVSVPQASGTDEACYQPQKKRQDSILHDVAYIGKPARLIVLGGDISVTSGDFCVITHSFASCYPITAFAQDMAPRH